MAHRETCMEILKDARNITARTHLSQDEYMKGVMDDGSGSGNELTADEIREVLATYPGPWQSRGSGIDDACARGVVHVIGRQGEDLLRRTILMLPALLAGHLAGMELTKGFSEEDKAAFTKRYTLHVKPTKRSKP